MSFTFTNKALDNLAGKSMEFENWKAFVKELSLHDLPACYKISTFGTNKEEFTKRVSEIMFFGDMRRSDGDFFSAIVNLLGLTLLTLEKDTVTIYDFVERYPDLLFK